METTIKLTTKIHCNGREYASCEEMPAELRRAYEQAMTTMKDSGGVQEGKTTKILLNCKEYGGVEEMPADIRVLYERAIGSAVAIRDAKSGNRSALRSILLLSSLLGLAALLAWSVAVRGWPMQ